MNEPKDDDASTIINRLDSTEPGRPIAASGIDQRKSSIIRIH